MGMNSHSNKNTVGARFELDSDLLETVIGLFLADAPKQIAELQAAVKNRDVDKIGAVSHTLRGSSDILGTTSISALALAVEQAARLGDFAAVAEQVPQLIGKLQKLVTELSSADFQEEA